MTLESSRREITMACPFGVVDGTNNEIVFAHFFTQVRAPLSMVKSKDKRSPKYDEL